MNLNGVGGVGQKLTLSYRTTIEKLKLKKTLELFSFLWVAVQSAGNELTRGRAGIKVALLDLYKI